MRIAFTGKGGSGKTTVSSLFARIAAADGYKVLGLDADINQHLASAIGYQGKLRSMGTEASSIKKHLLGSNKLATLATMHKTMPPGSGSELVYLDDNDWFIDNFAVRHNGIWLAGAGDIPEGNVGVKCYHGLNGAIELTLGHMIDRREDIVIVDMTAGADAFSSSLFTKVDVLALVVEPTLKSVSVFKQFEEHVKRYGITLMIVANKAVDDADKAFILKHVSEPVVWLRANESVRLQERDGQLRGVDPETASAMRDIRSELVSRPIDWDKREQLARHMHLRAVDTSQIDESFSLKSSAL